MKSSIIFTAIVLFTTSSFAQSSNTKANTSTTSQVSAAIVYNCVNPDEKSKKFCAEQEKNVVIKIENGYLVKQY